MTARLDKWLFHARFFKTRALARSAASSGTLRLNGARVHKPGLAVKAGDVLTIARSTEVLVVRVEAVGTRHGSAREARALYQIVEGCTPTATPVL